jgi:23S rRNA pseudouridine955/2504/2580 synthase
MSEGEVRTFTVSPDDDGIRVDRWFKRNLPDARFNVVSRWARTGQLRVDGKRVGPGDRVEAGQTIRVPPADPVAEKPRAKPARPTLSPDETAFVREMVVHEDASAFVVNKPPGLATQGGTNTNEHLDRLLDGLPGAEVSRPKLVHRLDKDTSGALLIARSPRAAAFFSKSFSGRTARKVYWALVVGVPQVRDGFIDLPIGKQFGTGGEKMCVDEDEGQPARTRYRVIDRAGIALPGSNSSPYRPHPPAARSHGSDRPPDRRRRQIWRPGRFLTGTISRKLHLHARRLRIDHPDGERLDVVAELPDHIAASLASLGFELAQGDLPLDEIKYSETPEGKRKAATAAAKSRARSARANAGRGGAR